MIAVLRASSAPVSLVSRARIVLLAAGCWLLAAEGLASWLVRADRAAGGFQWPDGGELAKSLPGRRDRRVEGPAAVGPTRAHDEVAVLAATLAVAPADLGVTHWSSRLVGDELGVSFATVARTWRKWNVQPWRIETFTFSTDPGLEAEIRDVVGLFLHPPTNAVVVSIDEKSQIQALDRTAPILPLRPGIPAGQTHDDKRNGTITLFAALEVATGRVPDRCYDQHAHAEFLDLLKLVAKIHPGVPLHVVCDNYATSGDGLATFPSQSPQRHTRRSREAPIVGGGAFLTERGWSRAG